MSTPISGTQGTLLVGSSAISELTAWTMVRTSNNPAWNSNTSGGEKKRIPGVRDTTGTLAGKIDKDKPIWNQLYPGNIYSVSLKHDSAVMWTGSILLSEISFDVNIDSGEPESWSANWEQAGALTKPT